MKKKNAVYAQSGGVTAVINASAYGVINACRQYDVIDKVYAAKNGILGILHEELFDTNIYSDDVIESLKYTTGGAFGSCRYKLKDINVDGREYRRLLEVFIAHDIEYFFYNGGNDSADTCFKVSQIAHELNYPLKAIHIPKTIDNDLVITDNCPGFGSAAKYIAISTYEASLDLISMCQTSTKVFIFEVMGRHSGFLAAASGLTASNSQNNFPHIILLPEIAFNQELFLQKINDTIKHYGYCVIVASEGIKDQNNNLLSKSNSRDSFGHMQLGGVASMLANIITTHLKLKCHYAIADYLQRSARHIAAEVDVNQAIEIARYGVRLAIDGKNAVMPIIERVSNKPYRWQLDHTDLINVANYEKKLPANFISNDGFNITPLCLDYLLPLIQGESYPPYKNGLPNYTQFHHQLIDKKLPPQDM